MDVEDTSRVLPDPNPRPGRARCLGLLRSPAFLPSRKILWLILPPPVLFPSWDRASLPLLGRRGVPVPPVSPVLLPGAFWSQGCCVEIVVKL